MLDEDFTHQKLKTGHILEKSDFISLRPKLDFISASDFENIIGKKLKKNIEAGEGISYRSGWR